MATPQGSVEDTPLSVWEASLKSVAEALNALLSATNALDDECSGKARNLVPGSRMLEQAAVEAIYSRVAEEYVGLDDFEQKIRSVRTTMQMLRNQSYTLVPINRLPDECLSAIFVMGSELDDGSRDDIGYTSEDVADESEGEEEEEVEEEESEEEGDDEEDEEDEGNDEDDDADDGVDEEEEPVVHDSRSFGLLVSQVCRRWRKVALDSGQLWTRIELTDQPPFEAMELWLERSRNYPLDVILNTEPFGVDGKALTLNLRMALEVLKSYVSQCAEPRCIDLTINSRSHKSIMLILSELSQLHRQLRLRTLKLVDRSRVFSGARGGKWKTAQLLELMRGVRNLQLREYRFPWDHPVYTNLAELRITGIESANQPTVAQFQAVLRSCPLLELLDLNRISIIADSHTRPSSTLMDCLRTIKVTDLDFDTFASIFELIRAPQLARLGIHTMHPGVLGSFEDARFTQVVSRFFTNPSQSMQCLSISDAEFTLLSPSIITLLRKLPGLTSLEICLVEDVHLILQALSHENVCPELRSLTLVDCDWKPEDLSVALLALVANRKHSRPIERLITRFCGLKTSAFVSLRKRVPYFVRTES
ncbi:hypothetical protein BOTBODRAFT_173339 [Botryobasidium botryosum FD-172 SS1]|uniref:F-box domain-containing protein n=1 Tax=Botryobasidium botryosum (strain FD-172 SS1) TaxID=930990 RepID=A0A067MWX7_BOTB1|nr:hypothetical protein BOTBODRAFT_173339 [Botryobasidium botryosum FD-172 SS1]